MAQIKLLKYENKHITKTDSVNDEITLKSVTAGSGGLYSVGNLAVSGNTYLGNDPSDVVIINAKISSNFEPAASGYDLGSAVQPWETVYTNNISNGTKTVLTGNLLDKTFDETVTGNWSFNGDIALGATSTDTISVSGYFNTDLIPKTDIIYDLGTSSLRWRNLYVQTLDDGTNSVSIANIPDLTENYTITGAWTFNDIDLPLGFKIGGVATSSGYVTAANLNTLTNGSNADALHTHSGVVAQDVKVIFTASGNIDEGAPVYLLTSDNTVAMADASSIGTGRVVGIAETAITGGATGYITISGFATIPTGKIDGGAFTVGLPVFLSETNTGYLKSTEPSTAGAVIYEIGMATKADQILISPKQSIIIS